MDLKINIPLLIRLLELAREGLTDDLQIHFLVEQMMALKSDCLSMKDYAKIVSVLTVK